MKLISKNVFAQRNKNYGPFEDLFEDLWSLQEIIINSNTKFNTLIN